MKWLELRVTVRSEDADLVALIVYESTGRGVVIEPGYFNGEGHPALFESTIIKGYLPAQAAGIIEKACAALSPYAIGTVDVLKLPETDWLKTWREHYKPFRVGRSLVVRPPWEKYTPLPGDLVITIDPGIAFGCGTHPTTRLCLELMERAVKPGMVVYDVGTGSGILAVAAARLGAANVVAVDEDETALRVASENIAHNGLEDVVDTVEGDLLKGMTGMADLIVSNIITGIIISLAPEAAARLNPGGVFVAGGIAAARADKVEEELKKYFSIKEIVLKDDWAAFLGVLRE
ncbi:MAG: 50S ribosomal protein L11 methyltransferase [Bacillota bacterium]